MVLCRKIHLVLLTFKDNSAHHGEWALRKLYSGTTIFFWSWSEVACEVYGCCSRFCALFILRDIRYKLWMWLTKHGSMSQRDGGVNRQHSLETGLSQAIRPMLICASESSVSVRSQQVRSEIPRSLVRIKATCLAIKLKWKNKTNPFAE